jgi:acetyl esterase/lipase
MSPAASSNFGNIREDDASAESLLTPKSLQLSMTAPRCPPYNTAQRSLLLGRRPRPQHHPYLAATTTQSHHHHRYHERLMDRKLYLPDHTRSNKGSKNLTNNTTTAAQSPFHSHIAAALPHPHLPSIGPDTSSQATRWLGTVLPLRWQNACRDSGGFRWIADTLVKVSIPVAAVSHPTAARQFVTLTQKRLRLSYAQSDDSPHAAVQFLDVFFPDDDDHKTKQQQQQQQHRRYKGMVFFVHGGAWGSGTPWFYRLVAVPFLKLGLAVAIVGYRIYPLGNVDDQVNDLEMAFQKLHQEYPEWCDASDSTQNPQEHWGTIVMGHSSGAHIALLWLVDRAKKQWLQHHQQQPQNQQTQAAMIVTTFVGISGPYNIDHHFDYEAARGVEEISPLKAANGFTRSEFLQHSPAWRLQNALADFSEDDNNNTMQDCFPTRMLLIHGMEDDTVPFTATSEAGRVLRSCGVVSCEEIYVPAIGHQDAVVHLMLGGKVCDAIVQWLQEREHQRQITLHSRL